MRDHVLVIDRDDDALLANQSYRTLYSADHVPSHAAEAFAAEADRNDATEEDYVASRLRYLAAPSSHPRWEAALSDGRRLLIAQHPMSNGGVVVVQTDVSEVYQSPERSTGPSSRTRSRWHSPI